MAEPWFMYNSVLFQKSYPDLYTCLEAKWLSFGFQICVKSLTELFLDDVRPQVRLVVVKGTSCSDAVRLFLVSLVEYWVQNHNFSFWAQPCQCIWLFIILSVLLNFALRIILDVIGFMVLSELKDNGLIDLALLTRIDDVHEIHSLKHETIWTLTKHLVNQESILN